ncbi:hypothetical protein [Devosia sp. SL43]|uniref:hypothetical protein n=1 Tax=Devosia sp. SL43 TaxID=2806348 RepID=UPI001F3828CC|nr:hypothetical protein [Devosia sp. SL43]UJW85287.1 hypothetical protein IM737_18090 [Devosia sp. SL43]
MSFRERQAWIAVLTTLAIWVYYFSAFWSDVLARQLDGGQVLTRFLICMGLTLVVMIALNVVAGVMTKKNIDRAPDELERQIEARADRIGFKLLEALVPLGLIGGLVATDTIRTAFPTDPGGSVAMIFANGILMAFVFTELVREAVHIASFRMTA